MLRSAPRIVAVAAALCCTGCHYFPNHHLVHPASRPPAIVTWSDDVELDRLLIHVEAARPAGEGPFPTVIVHPEGNKSADAMQGVIWDLAQHGYAAIAADYERRVDGGFERSLFAWRSESDAVAILQVVRGYKVVDQDRIGLLGFSQGGVFSLLIAAYAPQRIRAVVSYYPVTDFPAWLGKTRSGFGEDIAYGFVRRYFRSQAGPVSDEEYQRLLVAASPYYVAELIEAPVLLVHGDRDTTAPVEESRRMAERLTALGKPVELLVVPGGVHIFNFRQRQQAELAWEATLRWFDRYLQPPTNPNARPAEPGPAEAARPAGPCSGTF